MFLSDSVPGWTDSPGWVFSGSAHTPGGCLGCGITRWEFILEFILMFSCFSYQLKCNTVTVHWQRFLHQLCPSGWFLGDISEGLTDWSSHFCEMCPFSQLINIPVNIQLSHNIFVKKWCVFFFLGVVWREKYLWRWVGFLTWFFVYLCSHIVSDKG